MLATSKDCLDDFHYENAEYLLLDVSILKEEYRNFKYQLIRPTGGNGLYPDHIGTGVFFKWVADPDDGMKVTRGEIIGIPKPEIVEMWKKLYSDNK